MAAPTTPQVLAGLRDTTTRDAADALAHALRRHP